MFAAAIALVVMAWFDTTVVRDTIQRGSAIFDSSPSAFVMSLGMIMISGAVLLLASLAWRSGSVVVGVGYALVGMFSRSSCGSGRLPQDYTATRRPCCPSRSSRP